MSKILTPELVAALELGIDAAGRRIFLHGDVSESTIGLAIRGLYLMADMNQEPIELYVTSYGGVLDDAFALHDVTRTIRCPVHTVAVGKCMSAAPLLVACGHPGQRWAGPNTLFMLHDVRLEELEGSPTYLEAQVAAARDCMRRLAALLARYSKKPANHWSRIFRGKMDHFFTAEQAQEWGLIDHIWDEKEG